MLIRRILLRNLHSLRSKVEIDFTAAPLAECGLFAITGDTGAGKTTILDALTLALYGKICRNSKVHEVLSYGAKDGVAECEFEVKGHRFLAQWNIRRTKSKKENNTEIIRSVAEWDESKKAFIFKASRIKSEVNSFVEEVTGLDFERFTRSVLLAQGDFAAFLKAKPTDRSDLLERITGTEIYSQLSIAALRRYREEEGKLEELTRQKESLQVLTKEAQKELKNQLKTLQEENKVKKSALDFFLFQKNLLQKLHELERQEQELSIAVSKLETEKQAAQPQLAKLDLHRKAQPFQGRSVLLDDKLAEIEMTEANIARLKLEEAQLQSQWEAEQEKCKAAENNHATLKEQQAEIWRLLDKVTELDAGISRQTALLEKQKAEEFEVKKQLSEAALQRTTGEEKLAQLTQTVSELEDWFQKNKALSDLPEKLGTIEVLRNELREIFGKKRACQEERKEGERKQKEAQRKAELLENQLAVSKEKLSTLVTQFQREAPEPFMLSRQDLLEALQREIESLSERRHQFRKLWEQDSSYRGLLAEHAGILEALQNLEWEERQLDQHFLDLYDEEETLDKKLKAARKIYEQQLRIANYQKDRATLKEGDPCPLCFSTHHPFREHDLEPFTDEAKTALDEVQGRYDALQDRKRTFIQKHRELTAGVRVAEERQERLERLIGDAENTFRQLGASLDGEEFSGSIGERLAQKLTQFEQALAAKKTARDKLVRLHGELEQQEKEIVSLENQLKDMLNEARQCESNLEFIKSKETDLEKKFSATSANLNDIVKKYGYHFELESANGMFHELEEKGKAYLENKETLVNRRQESELTKQSLRQTLQISVTYETRFVALKKNSETEEQALKELKQQRYTLFEEKDPRQEREAFRQNLERQERILEEARQGLQTLQLSLHADRSNLAGQSTLLEKNKVTVEKLRNELIATLVPAGFASLESFMQALLSEEEAHRIELMVEDLRRREIETRRQMKSAAEEMEKHRSQIDIHKIEETVALMDVEVPISQDSLPATLEAAVLETEAELQTIQLTIGGINRQLSENEKRREEADVLLEKMEEQRKIFNRWAALYDLIGSADGSKFRKFAQGLTLQKLVQLANAHLQNLFGRYVILKRPGEDLELDIVDTYQAEHVRSMHTLSGGESFLVSLALALGLSDLAGRDANIRSLFIDEGFGTLDDQALDLAIGTLENLQSGGKTIGIISHVKELKERITVQIKVLKKGGGVSVVEVVG